MQQVQSEAKMSSAASCDGDIYRRVKHPMHKAEKYLNRPPAKHAAEMALIDRAVEYVAAKTPQSVDRGFLDAPCGVGRATIYLAQKGYAATGVDLGDGAVSVARAQVEQSGIEAVIDQADLFALPYKEQQFTAVLCFRFIHHMPTAEYRQKIITELCRVAHDYVLISYLSPWSFTSIKRKLRQKISGETQVQNSIPLKEIEGYFSNADFVKVADFARMPLVHTLHIAVFKRCAG